MKKKEMKLFQDKLEEIIPQTDTPEMTEIRKEIQTITDTAKETIKKIELNANIAKDNATFLKQMKDEQKPTSKEYHKKQLINKLQTIETKKIKLKNKVIIEACDKVLQLKKELHELQPFTLMEKRTEMEKIAIKMIREERSKSKNEQEKEELSKYIKFAQATEESKSKLFDDFLQRMADQAIETFNEQEQHSTKGGYSSEQKVKTTDNENDQRKNGTTANEKGGTKEG